MKKKLFRSGQCVNKRIKYWTLEVYIEADFDIKN